MHPWKLFRFFFFNDTATTEIYTLSLHDALPISAWLVVNRKTIGRDFKSNRCATHPRQTSPKSTSAVVYVATANSPPPEAMPMAASIKIVAAVVMPTRPPASRKIAPAPRKPRSEEHTSELQS